MIIKKDKISITKALVEVPRNLEVFWAVMRVLNQGKNPLKLIICCFYSPPNSKQKTSLINHIQIEYSKLKKSLPTAGTVILGDKNDLNSKKIVAIDPNLNSVFKQVLQHAISDH